MINKFLSGWTLIPQAECSEEDNSDVECDAAGNDDGNGGVDGDGGHISCADPDDGNDGDIEKVMQRMRKVMNVCGGAERVRRLRMKFFKKVMKRMRKVMNVRRESKETEDEIF